MTTRAHTTHPRTPKPSKAIAEKQRYVDVQLRNEEGTVIAEHNEVLIGEDGWFAFAPDVGQQRIAMVSLRLSAKQIDTSHMGP